MKARVGDTVRLAKGKRTAKIVSNQLLFGYRVQPGACYLDKPLKGTQYWNEQDLVLVSRPKIKNKINN